MKFVKGSDDCNPGSAENCKLIGGHGTKGVIQCDGEESLKCNVAWSLIYSLYILDKEEKGKKFMFKILYLTNYIKSNLYKLKHLLIKL